MAVSSAWRDGLALVPGSLRLILARWLLWIAAGLPAVIAGSAALEEAGARSPYFAGATRPFPMETLAAWLQEIPGALWGALAAGSIFAWAGGLLLTAGAVTVLQARQPDRVRVWRATFDAGPRTLLPFLRVAGLALLLLALGGRVLDLAFDRLGDHAEIAGWTGKASAIALPLCRAAATVAWASLVGACAFWGKVIVATDGRRRVRRLFGIVPVLCWRRPARALLAHCAAGAVSLFVGAAVLLAWGQSARLEGWFWGPLWGLVLLAQAWIWHWRLRACLLTWEDDEMADLRGIPDAPWHGFRRLRDRFRRRKGTIAPLEAPTAPDAPPLPTGID